MKRFHLLTLSSVVLGTLSFSACGPGSEGQAPFIEGLRLSADGQSAVVAWNRTDVDGVEKGSVCRFVAQNYNAADCERAPDHLLDVAANGDQYGALLNGADGFTRFTMGPRMSTNLSVARTTPNTSFGAMVRNGVATGAGAAAGAAFAAGAWNDATGHFDLWDGDVAGDVIVRGWDPKDKKPIIGKAEKARMAAAGDAIVIAYVVDGSGGQEIAAAIVTGNTTRGGSVNMNSQTSSTRLASGGDHYHPLAAWTDGKSFRVVIGNDNGPGFARFWLWDGTNLKESHPAEDTYCSAAAFAKNGAAVLGAFVPGGAVISASITFDGVDDDETPNLIATGGAQDIATGGECAIAVGGGVLYTAATWSTQKGDKPTQAQFGVLIDNRATGGGFETHYKTWDEGASLDEFVEAK